MTNAELEDWHHKTYWPLYKTLCKTPFPSKWDGGVRGKSFERIRKIGPSKDLRERIILAVTAQTLHRRKLYEKLGSMQQWDSFTKYKTFYCNRASDAWLNQNGWDDEIPDIQDDERRDLPTGKLCQCGREVMGPKFDVCTEHLARTDEQEMYEYRRKSMERQGLLPNKGEDRQAYYDRCRKEALKGIKQLKMR